MNRVGLAAAAALIVVIGGAALLLRPSATIGPPGSPSPTTSQPIPTQSIAGKDLVPAELLRNWVAAPHPFPGRETVQSLMFGFKFGHLSVTINYEEDDLFTSTAFVVGTNTLELSALSNGCDLGVVGHYTWSLSPGGTLLRLDLLDDPCSARAAALVGDWHSANCKDTTDVCWGDMEAGTYPTLFYGPRLDPSETPRPLYGAVRFTVPDGWAVAGDRTTDFRLLRSSDYAAEGPEGPAGQPTGIEAWIRPALNAQDVGCEAVPMPGVDTPNGFVLWLGRRISGLDAGPAQSITIDGHVGRWIDVSLSPDWPETCDGEPAIPLITEAVGSAGPAFGEPYQVVISGQTRMRLIFLDISQPELYTSHTAMILVTAPDRATFDAFIDEAMPIVQTFHFK